MNNICQVIEEGQLDKILNDRIGKLTLIMYSSKTSKVCKQFKPKFVELSKVNKEVFFVYVDAVNYKIVMNKYFQTCQVPTFLYYINAMEVARVVGPNEAVIVSFMRQLEEKIEMRKNQMLEEKNKQLQREQALQNEVVVHKEVIQSQKESVSLPPQKESVPPTPKYKNSDTELLEKKIAILNRLGEMCERGARLTNTYNLDSSYDDMMFEYRFQMDPSFRQHILALRKEVPLPPNHSETVDNGNNSNNNKQEQEELEKKHQKVNQIKQLTDLHEKMQLQSYQKLEQLKKIHELKEHSERNP